jgi:hypothetical protein
MLVAIFGVAFAWAFLWRSDDCADMERERARNMANGAAYPYTERDPWTCR